MTATARAYPLQNVLDGASSLAPEDGRSSGVYARRPPPALLAPSASAVVRAVRARIGEGSVVAAYLSASPRHGLSASVAPSARVGDLGSPLAMRLASWTCTLEDGCIADVPTYLAPWLGGARRALVVPLQTPIWRAGAIVVAAARFDRAALHDLEQYALDVALQIEGANRRALGSRAPEVLTALL